MSALLTIRGLHKRYGERQLFNLDTLTLDAACAYVLTGVNGAGKSTLLRILAGLERGDCDSFEFDGKQLRLHPYPPELRCDIVYVHQHPIMFSTSVAENIAFGLRARGMHGAALAQAVDRAIAWAGMEHARDTDPARLSGGEKQRVALARAKVLRPRVLLLDEPTANLDGPAREQVIALIPTLLEAGTTVVMACHDRDLIGLPGVRRLKLRDGHIEYRPQKGEHDEAP
ncbi:energy-coupling factor ABC transporter ATP-binding protein [Massilia solisilvae]|uniref:Energy-coupling factor ABC transporter ATP-binding protein n=1 Tax=Massilia solisilvae TaxID=1811225 RepID=A0ABT2BEH0_9BURK|nr:energy-coupling factor ABC transporter ATP-binding protein [Massilia solisilvae]MCS0606787.1 energy-coupling factor ABC transporter ATP-binding protein [Massilia solisilvae]